MSLMPKLLSVALACKALIFEPASLNIELNLIESLVRVLLKVSNLFNLPAVVLSRVVFSLKRSFVRVVFFCS